MIPRFEAEIQQLELFTYVRLSGPIDEDNELATLPSRIRGCMVAIDLAAIRNINNCGVRDWVKWREEIQARGIVLVLMECSPSIVAKLNSVSNFNEGGFIKSFYVPYYCQACEMEKAMLVDMDELRGDGPIKAPTCRCDACDGIMAFDDLEESYFAFVAQARQEQPLPEIQQHLNQLVPKSGERKILTGSVWGGSSFAGIPSTRASSDFSTKPSGSSSGPSVNSLRRLRNKTGLRTLRKTAPTAGITRRTPGRRGLLVFAAAGLLVIALIALAGLFFR